MTDERINERIALLCGWKIFSHWNNLWAPPRRVVEYECDAYPIPNYAGDLNACHEFEKLTAKQCREGDYWFYLREVLDFPDAESEWDKFYFFQAVHATARQRCEAFLRVHNQWEEEA